MRRSLIILGFFLAGVFLGFYDQIPDFLTQTDYSKYALYILMLLVGVGIGADLHALKALKRFNYRVVLVPLTTMVGTAIGVTIVFLLIPSFSLKEVLAVGSGFGYYSLSSIIITEMHGQSLGVVALLSNVMREVITLLLAPLFAIYFGKIAPICSGGATSMDTTLPIITTSSGKEYAIVSLFHGVVLTILVPFLVTMILSA